MGNYAEMIDFLYKLTVSQARMKETACKILSSSEDVSLSECVHDKAVGRQGKMKSLCKCNKNCWVFCRYHRIFILHLI